MFNTAAAGASSRFHGEKIHPGTPAGNVKHPPCFITPSATAEPCFEMLRSFLGVCMSPSLPQLLCGEFAILLLAAAISSIGVIWSLNSSF